jgi:tRNA (guanine10-N2)-methyltransferase
MSELPLLAVFYARAGYSRLEEFEAVAQRFGVFQTDWVWDRRILATNGGDIGPPIRQRLPEFGSEAHSSLADAAAQSVACRGVFEVLGQGDSLAECAASACALPVETLRERVQGTWRFESLVLGARKSLSREAFAARMEAFDLLLGRLDDQPVALEQPQHRICLVEDRQSLKDHSPVPDSGPRFRLLYRIPSNTKATQDLLRELGLGRRAFLSTSTLPPDRALLMCNLALAGAPRADAVLLDPFCGSGGLLLAGAALGAQTVGSDLDWKMVSENPWPIGMAPTPGRPQRGLERVRMVDNFREAGLPEPKALLTLDLFASDAPERLMAANEGRRFNALVCDPPYGRREFQGGEKSWAGELAFKVDATALFETVGTLLLRAQQMLLPGGRLVFLAPVRSPNDPSKPELQDLRDMLCRSGDVAGFSLLHTGVERVHRGLHRALVVMESAPEGESSL